MWPSRARLFCLLSILYIYKGKLANRPGLAKSEKIPIRGLSVITSCNRHDHVIACLSQPIQFRPIELVVLLSHKSKTLYTKGCFLMHILFLAVTPMFVVCWVYCDFGSLGSKCYAPWSSDDKSFTNKSFIK
jgi:hypothetical protein